jgi:deazaflavin-dependent oxidoreductase (nitroreductase family)
MNESKSEFQKPTAAEKVFNRIFGFLVGLGLGMRHNYLLQVRGRKSGRIYSTPVNVLDRGDRRYLIAPRGETQWVRNARASLRITLKRGRRRESFDLRILPDQEKPELLKAYLDGFSTTVQRYFPVPAGSGPDAFTQLAPRYPTFELIPLSTERRKV